MMLEYNDFDFVNVSHAVGLIKPDRDDVNDFGRTILYDNGWR